MAVRIPYFIEMRGCINCSASKSMKERHGREYGADHELMAKCMLMGCVNYGRSLVEPYMDPEEVVRMANEKRWTADPKKAENLRRYCMNVKKHFGKFYKTLGVSIDDIMKDIPA